MRSVLAAMVFLLSTVPSTLFAQGRMASANQRASTETKDTARSHRPLGGVALGQRLLESDDAATRVRGVTRLLSIGTEEAIDTLVQALEVNSPWMRDPKLRLTAIRGLAGETKRDNVRQYLMREVTDTSGLDGRGSVSPLAPLLRTTAALVLAHGGEKKATVALVTALLQGGIPGEVAKEAFHVYPPTSLEPFLEGRKRLPPVLAAFLGELGDMRAIDKLRRMLDEKDEASNVAAAIALAKLGDESARRPSLAWVQKSTPRLRLAAAEVLTSLGAKEGAPAIAGLLDTAGTRQEGLRFAFTSPHPTLSAPLAKLLPELADEDQPRAIAAMGRAGGAEELSALLDKPQHRVNALFALATMPGDAARGVLERAFGRDLAKQASVRRALIRAATVRALSLDDPPSGLRDRLRGLLAEKEPVDRAVALFGLVATGAMNLEAALAVACPSEACDAPLVAAAARGALSLHDGSSSLEALGPILARAMRASDPHIAENTNAKDPSANLAVAAAPWLLIHPEGGDLPTTVLANWAEGGSAIAPLAARALPSRDADDLRGRLKRLLSGTDPLVRAHAALGLARDPEPNTVSLLVQAYAFEEDAQVRGAVIRGLSSRKEPQRLTTLVLARDLDPDDSVRSLAEAALRGQTLEPTLRTPFGTEPRRRVAWVTVATSDGGLPTGATAACLVRADGLAVPTLADPDGTMLIPGLPEGTTILHVGQGTWAAPR